MGYIKLLIILIVGIGILSGAVYMTAEDPMTFLNLPGLVLVFGGTIVATFISYPLSTIVHAVLAVSNAMKKSSSNLQHRIAVYAEAMATLKKGNLQDTEEKIKGIHSPYLETAAQMMIGGCRGSLLQSIRRRR